MTNLSSSESNKNHLSSFSCDFSLIVYCAPLIHSKSNQHRQITTLQLACYLHRKKLFSSNSYPTEHLSKQKLTTFLGEILLQFSSPLLTKSHLLFTVLCFNILQVFFHSALYPKRHRFGSLYRTVNLFVNTYHLSLMRSIAHLE